MELAQLCNLNLEYDKLSRKLLDLKFEQENSQSENDLEDMIDLVNKQREVTFASCLYELKKLYKYLETVPESRMRLILSLRYINALSWSQIATCISNDLTADDIKKIHDRFLRRRTFVTM